MEFKNLYPVQMHCPNCGKQLTGYKSKDGALRIECPRCMVKIFSKLPLQAKKQFNIPCTNTDSRVDTEIVYHGKSHDKSVHKCL